MHRRGCRYLSFANRCGRIFLSFVYRRWGRVVNDANQSPIRTDHHTPQSGASRETGGGRGLGTLMSHPEWQATSAEQKMEFLYNSLFRCPRWFKSYEQPHRRSWTRSSWWRRCSPSGISRLHRPVRRSRSVVYAVRLNSGGPLARVIADSRLEGGQSCVGLSELALFWGLPADASAKYPAWASAAALQLRLRGLCRWVTMPPTLQS